MDYSKMSIAEKVFYLVNHGLSNDEIANRLPTADKDVAEELVGVIRDLADTHIHAQDPDALMTSLERIASSVSHAEAHRLESIADQAKQVDLEEGDYLGRVQEVTEQTYLVRESSSAKEAVETVEKGNGTPYGLPQYVRTPSSQEFEISEVVDGYVRVRGYVDPNVTPFKIKEV